MTNLNYAFISYSSKNQEIADAMRQILLRRGFHMWMAPYDIPAGHEYGAVINQALEDCGCLLLLLSGDAMDSVYVNKEVERAITYRKPVIPVEIEKVVLSASLKFFIGNTQIMALPDLNEDGPEFRKILAALTCFITPDKPGGSIGGGGAHVPTCDYGDLVEEFINKVKQPPVANAVGDLSETFIRQVREIYRIADNERILYTFKQGIVGFFGASNPKYRFYFTQTGLIAPKLNWLGYGTSEFRKILWEDFPLLTINDTNDAPDSLRVEGQQTFMMYTQLQTKNERDAWRYFYLDLQKYLQNNRHRIKK